MEVHNRPHVGPRSIEGAMHEDLLRRLVAGDMRETRVELREACRIEPAERRVRRRYQEAIGQPGAHVAGTADREAAGEQAGSEGHEQVAEVALVHCANAFTKKSGAPKLPDLSASRSGADAPSAYVQG